MILLRANIQNNRILEHLLLRLAQGETEALTPLYEQTKDALYVYALSLLKNRMDAEDIMHDTYLRIWHSAPRSCSEGCPMAWIYTIARNGCMSLLRQRSHQVALPEGDWLEAFLPEGSVDPDARLLLRECVQQLGGEDREILLLHAVSGLKHREIAELLSLPLSTVLSKYHRCVKRMRRLLNGEDTA